MLVYLLLFIFYSIQNSSEENLIPNGDFELMNHCPQGNHDIKATKYWNSPTKATPDYLNKCANNKSVSVPDNKYGHQKPYSGEGFVGIIVVNEFLKGFKQSDPYKEYIQTKLLKKLSKNKKYSIEMKVSLSDYSNCTFDNIQVSFSKKKLRKRCSGELKKELFYSLKGSKKPQNEGWVSLKYDFIADGNEKHIQIGIFDETELFCITSDAEYAVYYIDDVSLTEFKEQPFQDFTY